MPLTTNHTAHFLPLIASILVLCCACSDPPSSQDDTRDMDNIDMSIADSGADAPDTGADTAGSPALTSTSPVIWASTLARSRTRVRRQMIW